jgi:release factor glutamine methyltransferase
VSPAAIKIARFNAERHNLLDRLTFVEADRLGLPEAVVPDGGFNVLMSNPPYVAADIMDSLHATVRKYEPAVALTDGADGLSFYRSVATDGPGLLAAGGAVIVEVGDKQATAAIETVERTGKLVHRKTQKDRVTGHERVLMFSLGTGM